MLRQDKKREKLTLDSNTNLWNRTYSQSNAHHICQKLPTLDKEEITWSKKHMQMEISPCFQLPFQNKQIGHIKATREGSPELNNKRRQNQAFFSLKLSYRNVEIDPWRLALSMVVYGEIHCWWKKMINVNFRFCFC